MRWRGLDQLTRVVPNRGMSQQYPRPRTPPRPSSTNSHNISPSAHRSSPWVASPRASYSGIMNQGIESWSRSSLGDDDDDDDDEEEADIVYDDDEDEFGLPSLSSMRKKQAKKADTAPPKPINHGGGFGNNPSMLGVAAPNRQRANSSDIAEERGPSMYPTARKGEGKILRPQYKEILRGKITGNK